jgi:hypothetical protein
MTILLLLALLARPNLNETPGLVRPLSRAAVCSTRWGLDRRHVTDSNEETRRAAYGIKWADRARWNLTTSCRVSSEAPIRVLNLWPQPLAEAQGQRSS